MIHLFLLSLALKSESEKEGINLEAVVKLSADKIDKCASAIVAQTKDNIETLGKLDSELLAPAAELLLTELPEGSTFHLILDCIKKLGSPIAVTQVLSKFETEYLLSSHMSSNVFCDFAKARKKELQSKEASKRRAASLGIRESPKLVEPRKRVEAIILAAEKDRIKYRQEAAEKKHKSRSTSCAPRPTTKVDPLVAMEAPHFASKKATRRSFFPKGESQPNYLPSKRVVTGNDVLNFQKLTNEDVKQMFGKDVSSPPPSQRSKRIKEITNPKFEPTDCAHLFEDGNQSSSKLNIEGILFKKSLDESMISGDLNKSLLKP